MANSVGVDARPARPDQYGGRGRFQLREGSTSPRPAVRRRSERTRAQLRSENGWGRIVGPRSSARHLVLSSPRHREDEDACDRSSGQQRGPRGRPPAHGESVTTRSGLWARRAPPLLAVPAVTVSKPASESSRARVSRIAGSSSITRSRGTVRVMRSPGVQKKPTRAWSGARWCRLPAGRAGRGSRRSPRRGWSRSAGRAPRHGGRPQARGTRSSTPGAPGPDRRGPRGRELERLGRGRRAGGVLEQVDQIPASATDRPKDRGRRVHRTSTARPARTRAGSRGGAEQRAGGVSSGWDGRAARGGQGEQVVERRVRRSCSRATSRRLPPPPALPDVPAQPFEPELHGGQRRPQVGETARSSDV